MIFWKSYYYFLFGFSIIKSVYNYKEKQLHIGAVFPMRGDWAGGITCRPAATMALKDVNNQNIILPDYNLTITMRDSQCIAGLGTRMMYELIYTPPTKIIFLTGCSTVTTFVAEAAPRWNLIVMAFGASSPALSNRARFPSFFRTHPSASLQNPTRLKLLNYWSWKKVSLLWEMEEVFTSTVHDFEMLAKASNITVQKRLPLQKHSKAVVLAIKSLKNEDTRIIIGLFYEKLARLVFCEAFHSGLYGGKFVWIIIGWYPDDWWESNLEQEGVNCTVDQMKLAVEGHLTTESLMWNSDNVKTFSGLTSKQFQQRLINMLREQWKNDKMSKKLIDEKLNHLTKIPGYPEAPLAYDAIWAIATALDKAENRLRKNGMSLENFQYHSQPNEVYKEVHRALNETYFMGVSTLVYFDSSGSRISSTRIEQMINGSYDLLGHHHIRSDNFTLLKQPCWKNNKVPKDSIALISQRKVLPLSIYIVFCCLIIICAASGLFCIYWANKCTPKSTKQYGKLNLKLLCFVGYVLNMCGVIILGFDRTRLVKIESNTLFRILCQLKVGFISLGFSFGYGSLFLSIWVVYRIATNRKKLIPDKYIKNECESMDCDSQIHEMTSHSKILNHYKSEYSSWEIIGMLGSFCLTDFVVLAAWQYFDPLSRTRIYFNQENDLFDEDIHYQPYLEICDCKNISLWLGLIFGWKGLVLILGVLLSYETRNIKFSFASDTRSTGMAVYNVVVLSLITGPVSVLIKDQQSAHFVFVSTSILLASSLSLGLIYLPRLTRQFRKSRCQDEKKIVDDETIQLRKTEEEHHKRVNNENEQLRFQISQVDRQIEILRNQLMKAYQIENVTNKPIIAIHGEFISYENFNGQNEDAYMRQRKDKNDNIEHKSLLKSSWLSKHKTFTLDKECSDKYSMFKESTSGVYSDIGIISS